MDDAYPGGKKTEIKPVSVMCRLIWKSKSKFFFKHFVAMILIRFSFYICERYSMYIRILSEKCYCLIVYPLDLDPNGAWLGPGSGLHIYNVCASKTLI